MVDALPMGVQSAPVRSMFVVSTALAAAFCAVPQLIAALRIRLGQRRAARAFALGIEAVMRGEGFYYGLAARLGDGGGVGTAVRRACAFLKGKRPAFGGEGLAEHRGAAHDDHLQIIGTGHALGYHNLRRGVGGCCKAAVALQAAVAVQAGFIGDGQRAPVVEGALHGQRDARRNRQGATRRDGEGNIFRDVDILFQGIAAAHGAGLVALAVDQPAAVAGGGQRFSRWGPAVFQRKTDHTISHCWPAGWSCPRRSQPLRCQRGSGRKCRPPRSSPIRSGR